MNDDHSNELMKCACTSGETTGDGTIDIDVKSVHVYNAPKWNKESVQTIGINLVHMNRFGYEHGRVINSTDSFTTCRPNLNKCVDTENDAESEHMEWDRRNDLTRSSRISITFGGCVINMEVYMSVDTWTWGKIKLNVDTSDLENAPAAFSNYYLVHRKDVTQTPSVSGVRTSRGTVRSPNN